MKTPSETLDLVGVKAYDAIAVCLDRKDEDSIVGTIEVKNVVNPDTLWSRRTFRADIEALANETSDGILIHLMRQTDHKMMKSWYKNRTIPLKA